MDILILNNNAPPLGGAEYHIELLCQLLKKKGHKVHTFFFNDYGSVCNRAKAKVALQDFLQDKHFDVAHLHLMDYFYADCLQVLHQHHIKVVSTLHGYGLICPDGICLRRGNKTCDVCIKGAYYKAVFHRYSNFFDKSLNFLKNHLAFLKKFSKVKRIDSNLTKTSQPVCSPMVNKPQGLFSGIDVKAHFEYMWDILKRYYYETLLHQDYLNLNLIERFISPSQFLIDTFSRSCFNWNIDHLDNFLPLEDYSQDFSDTGNSKNNEPYILFAGRLVAEKGVLTLLDAVKGLNINLKIVGTGPLEPILQNRINSEPGLETVSLVGFKQGRELKTLIANAKFCVVPSEWWETWGFSAVEPLALGRPVIVSNIGALAEVVPHSAGMFFAPGCASDLHNVIFKMNSLPIEILDDMGSIGRKYVFQHYNEDVYYDKVIKIYSD